MNDEALLNMYAMFVTFETSQDANGWLKRCVHANIPLMLVMFDVSQVEMSWLNDEVDSNIELTSVTV